MGLSGKLIDPDEANKLGYDQEEELDELALKMSEMSAWELEELRFEMNHSREK